MSERRTASAECAGCTIHHVLGYTPDCPTCQQRAHADARTLLAQMSVLSDARGVSYIPSGAGAKHESTGTAGPGARDSDHDLFATWAQRFADPANEHRLPTLIRLARRELNARTCRKPMQTGDGPDGRESTWERDARIIDWYQGIPAEEAAIMESESGTHCPPENIRKVRRRNDCDAALGHRQTPREHRRRVARELRAQGKTLREIAVDMNVSLGTVQAHLDDASEAAA